MILSYLDNYKDIVALSVQDRRLRNLCDLTTCRKYRRIRIRDDEHLNPAFDFLLSILRNPRLGSYVRHLEVDRQPMCGDNYEKTEWQRNLGDGDLEKLKQAIEVAHYTGYDDDVILNMVMQSNPDIVPISEGLHRKQHVKIVRGTYIGQAIAVLLMAVCPELESLVLGIPFRNPGQRMNPDNHPDNAATGVAFPLHEFLRAVNHPQVKWPHLQQVRTVEFLGRPYLSKKWYSKCDFYGCAKVVHGLPKLERVSIDGMTEISDQYLAVRPKQRHLSELEFHHSDLSTIFLSPLMTSVHGLRKFTYTSGRIKGIGRFHRKGEHTRHFNAATFLRCLLRHRHTLEVLDLDYDYQFRRKIHLSIEEFVWEPGIEGPRKPYSPSSRRKEAGSLKDFTALTRLSIGVLSLFYFAQGLSRVPNPNIFKIDLVKALPPNLQYLTIRGYKPGLNKWHDHKLADLARDFDVDHPSLLEVQGIETPIPQGTIQARSWPQGPDLDFKLDDWSDYDHSTGGTAARNCGIGSPPGQASERIVSKYNVVRTSLIDNETTPLQVGNGDFAFGVDNTGMQTFLPFNTLSSWGWHNDSLPTNGEQLSDYTGVPRLTHGRNVSYDIPDPDLPEVSQWLIGNPNRINLGRIGLRYKDATLSAGKVTDPRQELDLWNGVITSTFKVDGEDVKVVTQGDFESDAVAFSIESALIESGDLSVELDFPYPPIHTTEYKYEVFVGVYDFPENHTTTIVTSGRESSTAHIYHELQETSYFVNLRWPSSSPLRLTQPRNATGLAKHRYTLNPRSQKSSLSFTALFSPAQSTPAPPAKIRRRNSLAWNKYWKTGGFMDLTSSPHPSANELQRRIILSQYHVRVNSAATGQSPQESGLMNNGWYGKFHMEMVVWHNAHWVTWGRHEYFDAIFPALYETLLPSSIERAAKMGWEGARWPKMTETNTGVSSPGGINGLLLWQQPHPMYLASLSYKASPTREALRKWDRVITATADYMASYAWFNESSGLYDLGPPSYGVTENTPPSETRNLAYEIAYWRYALDTAISFKEALGHPIPQPWSTVATHLSPPPIVSDLYAVYSGLNSSWWSDYSLTDDPRSLIMLQGILPDTPAVDEIIAKKTADKVDEVWRDEDIRGWGRVVLAINSARIGERERAVRHLTSERWVFDDAGFAVRGGDGGTPPPFMPGNAGYLLAIAYMAAGWEGSEGHAPGFPDDGSWIVRHEGLLKAL
ncbi:uncharacterized protein DSM5745_02723 [Aspergillus mulundensis]|uniref:Uncharacterized protein n=1 Tax=Aspergillus mulundensis TaxID=1810919 RepID=A0A3D8SIS5_9EURO|nr:hypothetical protein DSM5745_02723 [Aspergillus mulundensis]RDW86081.1 hypothetical protein DSM5745_02723 [Aspergillus mulundensis]